MSSTWFKSVSALKVLYKDGIFNEWKYIMISETAESNVLNFNGGHDYTRNIMTSGTYEACMKDTLSFAYEFDNGCSKWKPNAKDSIGFARICKKALEEAIESNEIPSDVDAVIGYMNMIPIFEGKEGFRVGTNCYGSTCVLANTVLDYIMGKYMIQEMNRDYHCEIESKANIKMIDWMINNKNKYLERYKVA